MQQLADAALSDPSIAIDETVQAKIMMLEQQVHHLSTDLNQAKMDNVTYARYFSP